MIVSISYSYIWVHWTNYSFKIQLGNKIHSGQFLELSCRQDCTFLFSNYLELKIVTTATLNGKKLTKFKKEYLSMLVDSANKYDFLIDRDINLP